MQLKRLALVGSIMLSLITVGVLSTNCGQDTKDFGTVNGVLVNGSGSSQPAVTAANTLLGLAKVEKNNINLSIKQSVYTTTSLPAYTSTTTFIAYNADAENWFASFTILAGSDGTPTTGSFVAIYCGTTNLTAPGSVKFTGQYSITTGEAINHQTGTVTLSYTV